MKSKWIKILLVLVTVVCLALPQAAMAAMAVDTPAADKDLDYLRSVMDMIKEKYKGEVTDTQLLEGALKGMFGTMDPYTQYFTPSEADTFLNQIEGSYKGIGVALSKVGDYVVIIKVFSASPAEKAGLAPGDKIAEVNGKSLVGVDPEVAAKQIMGEDGTKVTLGIIKNGAADITPIEVTRAEIKVNPVTYEIRGDIGYIKLEMFNSNSGEYITKALSAMDKANVKKIIMDLRNNPGGAVSQAVDIARNFVPKGLITKLDFKSEAIPDQEYYSYLQQSKYKLVLLVNGMSASASEILAGAVQDTQAGLLVGSKTFGKAKVQMMNPVLTPEAFKKYEAQLGVKLVDGSELASKYNIQPADSEIAGWTKITTGEYTTPKGRMIDMKGLNPDIEVADYTVKDKIDINSIQKLQKLSKPGLNGDGIDVYNTEKILRLSGYDVDMPDMKLDEKTFKAIAKFQKDSGLFPYGVLDFTTQQKLNDKLDKLIMQIDTQYAKAVDLINKL